MMKLLEILGLFACMGTALFAEAIPVKPPPDPTPSVLRDPATKITFYVESDRRHLSAIDSAGKLLWSREIIPASYPANASVRAEYIQAIRLFPGKNYIRIGVCGDGFGGMNIDIDKKTGKSTGHGEAS